MTWNHFICCQPFPLTPNVCVCMYVCVRICLRHALVNMHLITPHPPHS